MAMQISVHQKIYDTLSLPENEALSIVGGGDIRKRRERMLAFLKDHSWNEENYKNWIRGNVATEWTVQDKSRGLGDTVAKIAHKTGIAKLVEIKTKITGKPCGCKSRQNKLNEILSYEY